MKEGLKGIHKKNNNIENRQSMKVSSREILSIYSIINVYIRMYTNCHLGSSVFTQCVWRLNVCYSALPTRNPSSCLFPTQWERDWVSSELRFFSRRCPIQRQWTRWVHSGMHVCMLHTHVVHTVCSEILATFLIWRFGSQYQNHQICIDLLTMLCPCCATAKFNFRQY